MAALHKYIQQIAKLCEPQARSVVEVFLGLDQSIDPALIDCERIALEKTADHLRLPTPSLFFPNTESDALRIIIAELVIQDTMWNAKMASLNNAQNFPALLQKLHQNLQSVLSVHVEGAMAGSEIALRRF
jgi:hypothetical protein